MIDARDLVFQWPGQASACLHLPRWQVRAGEHVFLHGPSGSGKTTMLSLLAGVLTATRGQLQVMGKDLGRLRGAARDRYRADHLGLIFQQFNLIGHLSVLDNVLLPCRFSARRAQAVRQGGLTAQQLLQRLDLAPDLWQRPAQQLSVGQQQRVAAARALIGQPALIIADEPTSALDASRQQAFLQLLSQACREAHATLIFVSHDLRLAQGSAGQQDQTPHPAPQFDTCISLTELNLAAQSDRDATTSAPQPGSPR